jgi:prephenate dehydrogenase
VSAPKTVAVIGLGMIGGSVARGLADKGVEVLGYDTNDSYLDAAVDSGVISRRLQSNFDDIGNAEAVVIAIYGDAAVQALESLKQHNERVRLITDVGSTKRTIVASADKVGLGNCFVGSHPFAGDHRSGWHASRSDLFENEIVYLSPTSQSTESAMEAAKSLWMRLGARPVRMDAAEHDALLAWTSHLPHIVSASIALALAERGIGRRQLGRGGKDMARLSGGSPDLWTAIALENASEIDAALDAVERELSGFRLMLRQRDRNGVREQLTRARNWHEHAEG